MSISGRKKRKEQFENNEIYTPNYQRYFYYPALPDNCFTFKIRAFDEANILLSDEQQHTENSIEIKLSSQSSIRQKNTLPYIADTLNYLNGTKFEHFWISWMDKGKIEVGLVNGLKFLKLTTPNMPAIKYIGIKSKEQRDMWILEFDEPKCPDSHNYKTVQTNCYEAVKIPMKITLPPVLIMYQKDILQQFQIDYENFKNSNKIHVFTEAYLKRILQELEENYKTAKDNHKKIFRENHFNNEAKEYLKENIYDDIKKIFFEYYENVANQLNRYNNEENSIIDIDNKFNRYRNAENSAEIKQNIIKKDFFYKQPEHNLTKCSPEAIHPYAKNKSLCECKSGWAGNGIFCGIDTDNDKWPDQDLKCSDKYCKADNCPSISNFDQEDINKDGFGDACDSDSDGDGIRNEEDNCPKISNPAQEDGDNDGTGDVCDNCLKIKNSDQLDTDQDGMGDLCDDDIDNDGIPNSKDNCKLINNIKQLDSDNDGWGNECDNCPNKSNKDQADIDFDGIGNECDDDMDNDGIKNNKDNCQKIPNANQTDSDNDGWGDECDNCPIKVNKEQIDNDNDGIGNECDNCPEVPNKNQSDVDDDKIGDVCDNCAIKNSKQEDDDNDLVGDACDTNKDTDGDGRQDNLDNCPYIVNSNQLDSDNNGKGNACEYDSEQLDKCSSNKTIISLSPFMVVNLDKHADKSRAKNPVWKSEDYTILQSVKSDPSLVVGSDFFGGVDYEGIMTVNSHEFDDSSQIGLTFSFQSNRKFYLIKWHRKTNERSQALGLEINRIISFSGPGYNLRRFLLLNNDQTQGNLIWRDENKLKWIENIEYKWKLIHRPNIGLIRLKIFQDDKKIIDSGKLYDKALKGGRLGVYAFNQNMVMWKDFKIQCNESKIEEDAD